ncbi:MAG: hypothetical protein MZV64_35590 [Ignavibacteriales bacterium]|nr:hypothetical protein [Ignavibacteriales bacterium]
MPEKRLDVEGSSRADQFQQGDRTQAPRGLDSRRQERQVCARPRSFLPGSGAPFPQASERLSREQPKLSPFFHKPTVCVVLTENQPVFGTRSEHPIRFFCALVHEVVNENPDDASDRCRTNSSPSPFAPSAALIPAMRPRAAALRIRTSH